MKIAFLAIVALSALIAAPAQVADMPVKAPPATPASIFIWTGLYVGMTEAGAFRGKMCLGLTTSN